MKGVKSGSGNGGKYRTIRLHQPCLPTRRATVQIMLWAGAGGTSPSLACFSSFLRTRLRFNSDR